MKIADLPPLPPESRAVAERAITHINRCEFIKEKLGRVAAYNYHIRNKGNPCSIDAQKDFEILIRGN